MIRCVWIEAALYQTQLTIVSTSLIVPKLNSQPIPPLYHYLLPTCSDLGTWSTYIL